MMQVASPKSVSTHRAQPVGCQNEDTSPGDVQASESDMILQRRLSTAPILPGSPSTPTRSTFPFKPAAVTPQGGRRSECPFRPRPVVPVLTPPSRSHKIYNPPQRCKTFPNIDDSPSRAIKIEAPAWLTDFTENAKRCSAAATSFSIDVSEDIPIFPVPVNDDARQDKEECWWLDDMNNWEPLREQPHRTVRNFLIELRSETIDNVASTHSVVDDKDKSNELDDALRDLLKLDKTARALPEISSLQHQVFELKRYVMSAHHLHEDKRERMHVVLQKIESVITGKDERSEEMGENKNRNTMTMEEYYRKTKVGLTGGSLVTAGLVLIPAPVIPGILVVYGGLLVLASEFDSAKTAVEAIKVPMKELLKDEEDPNKGIYDCFHMIMWEEMIGYAADPELDEEFMAIMRMKPWKDNVQNGGFSDDAEIERAQREKKNAMKRYARQLLLLEDPDDTHEEQDENNNDKSVYSWMGRKKDDTSNGVHQNSKRVDG